MHGALERTSTSILALSLCLAPAADGGACADPVVPDGGFAIVENTVQIARSDGYLVMTDIRYPSDPPGPCGWPLVLLIHGGGGNKGVVAGTARNLARAGYVTCAYDVRGQGPSMASNPDALAHDVTGLRELIDLFEAMEAVEALYAPLVDFDRIGVTGYSQGGTHSWWAAAHSGRLPPPNPWRTEPFPVVSAVVAKDSTGGSQSGASTAFGNRMVERLFGPTGTIYQPAVVAALVPIVLAEDFAGFAAAATAPGVATAPLLPLTTVPVFAHASYDDKRVSSSAVVASYNLVPDTTPKRLQLGTGGHASPQNSLDQALYGETRERWLDRFLKGEMNGVDTEARIFAQVTPDVLAEYLAADSLWDFRIHDALPAPETVASRLYLDASGALLDSSAPAATTRPLVHVVPAAFDIDAYTTLLPSAAQLMSILPLAALAYDTAPLAVDTHLDGEATIQIAVDTLDPDYQIHAVLFDVDPNGDARFVSRGGVSVRGQAGASTLAMQTYRQSYVFRAGHRIRLQLENLAIHRPPTGGPPEIKWVPTFASSSVDVVEGGATPSFIDLPVLPFPGPTLTTFPFEQSIGAPANQRLAVHTDSARMGHPYLLLPTLSGTSPGTSVIGVDVPINFDSVTWAYAAMPGLPPFVAAAGTLDTTGSALLGAQLAGLPLPPALIGIELSMAVLIDGGSPAATNAVTVPFIP